MPTPPASDASLQASRSFRQGEIPIDPSLLPDRIQRRAGSTSALQRTAATNRTEGVANDLIGAKNTILGLDQSVNALERSKGELQAELENKKKIMILQDERLQKLEGIVVRHGLNTGSARVLTAP